MLTVIALGVLAVLAILSISDFLIALIQMGTGVHQSSSQRNRIRKRTLPNRFSLIAPIRGFIKAIDSALGRRWPGQKVTQRAAIASMTSRTSRMGERNPN